MHLLAFLLSVGIFCQEVIGGLHLRPYRSCNCEDPHQKEVTGALHLRPYHQSCNCNVQHQKGRLKRFTPPSQSDTNLNPNQLHVLPQTTVSNQNHFSGNPEDGKTISSNHLHFNQSNRGVNTEIEGNDKDSEIVGLGGLAHIHALTSRGRARALVARARARARLHHPLLLAGTPEDYLDNNNVKMDHSQKHLQVPDAIVSLQPPRPNLIPKQDHQNFSKHTSTFPINQNLNWAKPIKPSSVRPLQLDMHFKQDHRGSLSAQINPLDLQIANTQLQRSHGEAFDALPPPNENQQIIPENEGRSRADFPHFEDGAPLSLENFARSVDSYDNNQNLPPFYAEPTVNYNEQPEIHIHNIDNSEEVYQNCRPGFSIIPTNWKPPPDSNLYVQGDYQQSEGQEPILAVLPGKWTDDDGYDTYFYEDYDVIPITYNIPDEVSGNYYGRSAETEESAQDATPPQFVGIKKQLQNWENNPKILHSNSNNLMGKQRTADPFEKRHFHKGHAHTFIHQHIHNRGQPAISGHTSGFQIQNSNFVQPTGQIQHSGFSQSQSQAQNSGFYQQQIPESSGHIPIEHSSFSQSQAQTQNFGFSKRPSHGHLITINKQKTTVVVPPGGHQNVEIAQVTGHNNAASQSQGSSNAHLSGFANNQFAPQNQNFELPAGHKNVEIAQVTGHNNAVSQSQGSSHAHLGGFANNQFAGQNHNLEFSAGHQNIELAHVAGQNNAVTQSQASNKAHLNGFANNQFAPQNQNFQTGHHNIEIAEVTGHNNAVSQSQASNKAHLGGFSNNGLSSQDQNFQSSQVFGDHNSVSQSQLSDQIPFVGRESEGFVGDPYIINFPRRSDVWRTHDDAPQKVLRKRSIDDNNMDDGLKTDSKFSKKFSDILIQQSKILKEIQESARDDKELLFITEMGSNLLDDLENSLKAHPMTKRSVPLLRLVADPNAKLDVPKTLENMGTVARNSFENKRAPLYHIKNMASSAKDAFLSTLRILPQDFLVPSKYKIIDRETENVELPNLQISKRGDQNVGAINPSVLPRARSLRERIRQRQNPPKEVPVRQPEMLREPADPYNFFDTYKKVGSMFRESIRSSQDTLAHMNEMYHSARKALATTRHVAPRVLLSSMRIPAVQQHPPLLPRNDKLLVITPKILQLKQEAVGAPHYAENMEELVGVGHVMDSLGISNPDAEQVGRRRIVFHPANPGFERSSLLERRPIVPNLEARSNFAEETAPPQTNREKLKRYFVLADTLQAEAPEENIQETMVALNNAREAVGASSLKDFVLQMKDGLSTLFKYKLGEAKNQLSEQLGVPNLDFQKLKGKISLKPEGQSPVTLKFKVNNPLSQHVNSDVNRDHRKFSPEKTLIPKNSPASESQDSNSINETVGAGLPLPKELLKPFMGQPSRSERRQFFEEYGDSVESSEEKKTEKKIPHKELPNQVNQIPGNAQGSKQEVIGAINPIIFNKTFQLCDNESPFKILAGENATKHTNHSSGTFESTTNKDDSSEMWEHKCNYPRTTTEKSIETTTTELEDKSNGIESTSTETVTTEKLNGIESTSIEITTTEHISEKSNGMDNASIEMTTTEGVSEKPNGIETTTKVNGKKLDDEINPTISTEGIEITTNNINSEGSITKNNQTDAVGIMKMGKALLTPFMGKPTKKEMETYFDQYGDSYGEDSSEDGYMGRSRAGNSEEFQMLSTDESREKIRGKGSSRTSPTNQQHNLGDVLELNFL